MKEEQKWVGGPRSGNKLLDAFSPADVEGRADAIAASLGTSSTASRVGTLFATDLAAATRQASGDLGSALFGDWRDLGTAILTGLRAGGAEMHEIGRRGGAVGERTGSRILLDGDGVAHVLGLHWGWRDVFQGVSGQLRVSRRRGGEQLRKTVMGSRKDKLRRWATAGRSGPDGSGSRDEPPKSGDVEADARWMERRGGRTAPREASRPLLTLRAPRLEPLVAMLLGREETRSRGVGRDECACTWTKHGKAWRSMGSRRVLPTPKYSMFLGFPHVSAGCRAPCTVLEPPVLEPPSPGADHPAPSTELPAPAMP